MTESENYRKDGTFPKGDAGDEGVTVIVAPNGARKTVQDHPRLPVTPAQIAAETQAAVAAGATMVHAHARDEEGKHSLDPGLNRAVMEAIRDTVGDRVVVQLTTEAVGIYSPEQQMRLIRDVKPEAASFALKELIPSPQYETVAREFFHWISDEGIIAQYILYSAEEVERYHQLKEAGVIPQGQHHLLFVLGRYSANLHSEPTDLLPFVAAHRDKVPWAVCAFGEQEHRCAVTAMALGGDVRVGFENNLQDMHGEVATSNAVLVQQVADAAKTMGRSLLGANEFRHKMRQL